MTIEYLMCRADLNFEVDLGVNGAIGTVMTKWDLLYSDNASFSSIVKNKLNALHSPLIVSLSTGLRIDGILFEVGPTEEKVTYFANIIIGTSAGTHLNFTKYGTLLLLFY